MNIFSLLFILALNTVDLDVVSVPMAGDAKIAMSLGARAEMRREGMVTRLKIDIDHIGPPSMLGAAFNTYVVWAVSPEGILDNMGELELKNAKAQFSATTRLTQFGVLVTAEPHYMVDKPSAAVAYRALVPEGDIRRKTVAAEVGAYDYSQLKPSPPTAVMNSVIQARAAFQIAQLAHADRLADSDFRSAQVAIGAVDELVNRAAPLDILWPAANEAIRLSQRAASSARAVR